MSKPAAIALTAAIRPAEFADRLRGRRQQHEPPSDLSLVKTHRDPMRTAHEIAGSVDCQSCEAALSTIEREVADRLAGPRDYLQLHHDGGPMLSRMLWVLVRHTNPSLVIETGVARGVSSAYVLDAMAANGAGQLVSIDLPPLGNGWSKLVGSAVPPRLHNRWTYLRGASARVLPRVIRKYGGPDIFVHDGLHTTENMLREFHAAWEAMQPGALLVSDDVEDSYAWDRFVSPSIDQWVVEEPGKDGILAVARKPAP